MKIVDLKGKEIEVEDLRLALMQADDFRHYRLGGAENEDFNRKQQVYWEDIYLKLVGLTEAR